ncbi:MAG: hypothetical protein ACLFUB_11605 [Cyclobacteriaceae bacterium]
MIRKDFFLKQLQQLDEIIRKVTALRRESKEDEAQHEIHTAYSKLLGLDSAAFSEGMEAGKLQEEFSLNLQQLDILARLLYEEGNIHYDLQNEQAEMKFSLALDIYQYLNREEKIFSFEREAAMADLIQKLSD